MAASSKLDSRKKAARRGNSSEAASAASEEAFSSPARIHRWPHWAKVIASLVLVYHVAAMFVSPWAVPPTSSLATELQKYFAHYQTLLYLNHGYRFFAPNPGPASVVVYELEFADGSKSSGLFPDRDAINRDYPRLLYHRWFMLSESLGRFLGEQVTEKEFRQFQDDETQRAQQIKMAGREEEAQQLLAQVAQQEQLWNEAIQIRRQLLTPLAKRLLKDNEAVSVSIFLNQRTIPAPDQVARGFKTNDPRFLPTETAIEMGSWNATDLEKEPGDIQAIESLPGPIGQLEGDAK